MTEIALIADSPAARATVEAVLRDAGYSIGVSAPDPHGEREGTGVLVAKGSPLAALASARSDLRLARVICVPPERDLRMVRKLVDAGADGIVWPDRIEQSLAPTVAAVRAGQICVPLETRRQLRRPELTRREKQVLSLIVMGQANSEIAAQLYVSEATVKSHLSSAFRKLGANSRAEAVRIIADPAEGFGTGVLSIT